MTLLITNIKKLVQVEESPRLKVCGKEMSTLNCIDDAFLLIHDGLIKDFGTMVELQTPNSKIQTINASGKFVLPCWCDTHTHIVYAGSREAEFVNRINGLTYEEIAKRGGGILNSVKLLHDTSEEKLFESASHRLHDMMMTGTGAVEIKSGYGLNMEDELKMLRVIKRLKETSELTIKSTFLGAHAVPKDASTSLSITGTSFGMTKEKYISLLIEEMLPRIAEEKLADYCDVFCEQNYFTKEDTIKILNAAAKHGMKGKVHAEQLSHSGGIEAGVECNAISVDHLEYTNENDIALLKNSSTMPTLLPGAAFFLSLQNPPARKMIDAGLPVAVATDYNPGSSPCGNMNLMISLLCIQYKMTPEEAINAATINSAYAMDLSSTHGSIARGKKANVFITKEISSVAFLPYSFGQNLIEQVIINGKLQ
jgi:imidazolonepropionase